MDVTHPNRGLCAVFATLMLCALIAGCQNGQQTAMSNPFLGPDRVPPPSTRTLAPGAAQPYYPGEPLPAVQSAAPVMTTEPMVVASAATPPIAPAPNEPAISIPVDQSDLRFAAPPRELVAAAPPVANQPAAFQQVVATQPTTPFAPAQPVAPQPFQPTGPMQQINTVQPTSPFQPTSPVQSTNAVPQVASVTRVPQPVRQVSPIAPSPPDAQAYYVEPDLAEPYTDPVIDTASYAHESGPWRAPRVPGSSGMARSQVASTTTIPVTPVGPTTAVVPAGPNTMGVQLRAVPSEPAPASPAPRIRLPGYATPAVTMAPVAPQPTYVAAVPATPPMAGMQTVTVTTLPTQMHAPPLMPTPVDQVATQPPSATFGSPDGFRARGSGQ